MLARSSDPDTAQKTTNDSALGAQRTSQSQRSSRILITLSKLWPTSPVQQSQASLNLIA